MRLRPILLRKKRVIETACPRSFNSKFTSSPTFGKSELKKLAAENG